MRGRRFQHPPMRNLLQIWVCFVHFVQSARRLHCSPCVLSSSALSLGLQYQTQEGRLAIRPKQWIIGISRRRFLPRDVSPVPYCDARWRKVSYGMQRERSTMMSPAHAGLFSEKRACHQGYEGLPVTRSFHLSFICDYTGNVLRFSKKGTSLCIDLSPVVRLLMP
jgi:hypothetical protein